MKKLLSLTFFLIILLSLVSNSLATDRVATGDDYLRNYSIYDVKNITVQVVCLSGDCKSVWPSGTGGGSNYDQNLNISSNVTHNKVTATNGFFGSLNWSYLLNVPSYVKDWTNDISNVNTRVTDTNTTAVNALSQANACIANVSTIGNWSADKSNYATTTTTNNLQTNITALLSSNATYNTKIDAVNLTAVQANTTANRIALNLSSMGNWSADKSSYATTTITSNLQTNITTLIGNVTNLQTNVTALISSNTTTNSRIDSLNASKAPTGNCTGTTVVQNITGTGVQCMTPAGTGSITMTDVVNGVGNWSLDKPNVTLNISNLQTNVTALISSNLTALRNNTYSVNVSLTKLLIANPASACNAGYAITQINGDGTNTCSAFALASDVTNLQTNITSLWNWNGTQATDIANLKTNDSNIESQVTGIQTNVSQVNTTAQSALSTANAKAGTGTASCTDGKFAQNVTTSTGGVTSQCATPVTSSSAGNPFDQWLNTTGNVTFNNLTITKNLTVNKIFFTNSTNQQIAAYFYGTDTGGIRVLGSFLQVKSLSVDDGISSSTINGYATDNSSKAKIGLCTDGAFVQNETINGPQCAIPSTTGTTYTNGTGLSLVNNQFNITSDYNKTTDLKTYFDTLYGTLTQITGIQTNVSQVNTTAQSALSTANGKVSPVTCTGSNVVQTTTTAGGTCYDTSIYATTTTTTNLQTNITNLWNWNITNANDIANLKINDTNLQTNITNLWNWNISQNTRMSNIETNTTSLWNWNVTIASDVANLKTADISRLQNNTFINISGMSMPNFSIVSSANLTTINFNGSLCFNDASDPTLCISQSDNWNLTHALEMNDSQPIYTNRAKTTYSYSNGTCYFIITPTANMTIGC